MERFFILVPDNHYAYPELEGFSETAIDPLTADELLTRYTDASYSGFAMSEDTGEEEPEREDFESQEEYDAAVEEYQINRESYASGLFNEYGNFDVFHSSYFVSFSVNESILEDYINDIINYNIDLENTSMEDVFMRELVEKDGVDFIVSFGGKNIGKLITKDIDLIDVDGTSTKMKDLIINRYRSGETLTAAKIFNAIKKIDSSMIDMIKSELTEDEFAHLSQTDKGLGLLRRLGEQRIPIQE